MNSGLDIKNQLVGKILDQLRDMQTESKALGDAPQNKSQAGDGKTFADHLREGVNAVNNQATVADKMGVELATGKSGNIHETMIAATQAELSFNLMVQVRNKALDAYNEIMRMPV